MASVKFSDGSMIFLAIAVAAAPQSPISTTVSADDGRRMQQQFPSINWVAGECPSGSPIVRVHSDKPAAQPVIGGFGASMTESSAINLNALPAAKQTELL